jgi:hypothetical protein
MNKIAVEYLLCYQKGRLEFFLSLVFKSVHFSVSETLKISIGYVFFALCLSRTGG